MSLTISFECLDFVKRRREMENTERKVVHKFRTRFDGGHYGWCECGTWSMTDPVCSRVEAKNRHRDHLSETS